MTVYTVFYDRDSDHPDLVGIYSTEALAQARIARFGHWDQRLLYVSAYTLDAE